LRKLKKETPKTININTLQIILSTM
jgi:hypothetical protein